MAKTHSSPGPASRRSFDDILQSLRDDDDPVPAFSALRFAQELQLDWQALLGHADVYPNDLERAPTSEALQAYMRDAIRVLKVAYEVSGDWDRTKAWYRTDPLSTFEYLTAEKMVVAGRTEDLLRYLLSVEAGAAG